MERRESTESWESNDKVKEYHKGLMQEMEQSREKWNKTKVDLWQLQVKEFCEEFGVDADTLPNMKLAGAVPTKDKRTTTGKIKWQEIKLSEEQLSKIEEEKAKRASQVKSKGVKKDFSGFDRIVADEEAAKDAEDGTEKWAGFVSDASKINNKTVEQSMKKYDEFAQNHPRLAKIRDFFSKLVGGRRSNDERATKLHPIPKDVQSIKKTAGQLGNEFRSKIKTRTPVGKTTKIKTKNEKQHGEEEIR